MASIVVEDYSTETGLRVRITSPATGTTVQLTGDEWDQLVEGIKADRYVEFAKEPRVPFVY